ncbi:ABC transporter permease [Falsirhodobacter algicola]|uniref:ABC transporter permease subunit n=1 Tax=Falsirhodobacter algicola TaxID=2692330 RepID=A0A8J8SLR8_9RHOB|nr:ABC transporter permease subunit [Falsirhodobacter algicola]QUS37330.1 ABC transporter permease subunit [Falsirhodobacter algicola]
MSRAERTLWSGAALILLIPAWYLAAAQATFIESPFAVLAALPHFLSDPATWSNIGLTLGRVVAGLSLGVVAGFAAAFVMSRSRFMGDVLGWYVIAALRTPSAIAAILALAIFKGSEVGYILVVAFITFPYMAMGMRDGLNSADNELDEMSRIYHLGLLTQVRHVWAPYVAPYIFASLRNAHALAWKVIVVAEIFGAARAGFGAKFEHAWEYMFMIEVHLWLLVFMAIVLIAEYGLIRTLEKHTFRWRKEA